MCIVKIHEVMHYYSVCAGKTSYASIRVYHAVHDIESMRRASNPVHTVYSMHEYMHVYSYTLDIIIYQY